MRIIETSNYTELSRKVASLIAAQVTLKPDSVLGLATGSTPIGTYKELVEWHKQGDLDFSKVKSVNLDEYCGLSPLNEQSYRYFMDSNLFNFVNINKENTYVPNGLATDLEEECKNYDELIQSLGGVDVQILGIGLNGHIGFNEPDSFFEASTHVVDLDQSTIEANARFFSSIDEVPRQAITMGIKTIMKAKKIILVASGANKKEIIEKAIYGPVTPEVPGSILQFHPDVTVVYNFN